MGIGWFLFVAGIAFVVLLVAARGTAVFDSIVGGIASAIGWLWGNLTTRPFRTLLGIGVFVVFFFLVWDAVRVSLGARSMFREALRKGYTCLFTGEKCPAIDWDVNIPDSYDDAGGDDEESYDDSDDDGNVDDGDEDETVSDSNCTRRRQTPDDGTFKVTGPASVEAWTNDEDSPWGREYGEDVHKVLVPEGETIRIPSGGGVAYICPSERKARRLYDDNPYPPGDIGLID